MPYLAGRAHSAAVPGWRELTGSPHPRTRVIIARAECDYRSQAVFGDELEVRMTVGDIGRSSFVLRYAVVRVPDERLVAEGSTVMVAFDYEAARSMPLPPETRSLLVSLGTDPGRT